MLMESWFPAYSGYVLYLFGNLLYNYGYVTSPGYPHGHFHLP